MQGPAILASNHLSYSDWLFMPLTIPRRVTFVAKAEYFTTPGLKGWLQKTFFSGAGQVPIDRSERQRGGRGDQHGSQDPRERRPVRDLSRGHAVARRPAVPRADRGRTDGARGEGAGHPGRRDRHRHRRTARQGLRTVLEAARAFRRGARLLPLRGHGGRPVRAALDHRRDHVRDHGAVRARSTSTCTPGRAKEDAQAEAKAAAVAARAEAKAAAVARAEAKAAATKAEAEVKAKTSRPDTKKQDD